MARVEEVAPPELAEAAPDGQPGVRIVRIAKPEEGEPTGEGWAVLRSLLLLVGGMILVSYFLFAR